MLLTLPLALSLMASAVSHAAEMPPPAATSTADELYVLDAQARLPSSDTSWDYI